jgi:DNA polymerase III epsilon subunit-like protein
MSAKVAAEHIWIDDPMGGEFQMLLKAPGDPVTSEEKKQHGITDKQLRDQTPEEEKAGRAP